MSRGAKILTVAGAVGALLFFANSALFVPRLNGKPTILAHRGISQQFDPTGIGNDTCTAERIFPPTHSLLENTLPSMKAAFDAGADIVEFDVHPTTDGQFAVFHDWTLDCRTDGHGETRRHTLPQLKALDVGYGYTADGGQTFPFRGKGIGLMPSLDEVLTNFPDRRFLINVKSNDPAEGFLLAESVSRMEPRRQRQLMFYGGDQPISVLRERLPEAVTMSQERLKGCLVTYVLVGWGGVIPEACVHQLVFVPENIAPWLWGWPNRFVDRMASVGSPVFLLGPVDRRKQMAGIDTAEQISHLPDGYTGGVVTNEIEAITSALHRR